MQALQFLGRVKGGEDKDHLPAARVLRLAARRPEIGSQRLPCQASRPPSSTSRTGSLRSSGQPGQAGATTWVRAAARHSAAASSATRRYASGPFPFPPAARQIEGSQHGKGGGGGTEKRHRRLDLFPGGRGSAHMQIRSPRQHRQGFVGGIGSHIRAERQRVAAEGPQVAAVRVVYQQGRPRPAAGRRKGRYIAEPSAVIRVGHIYGSYRLVRGERTFHIFHSGLLKTAVLLPFRPEPGHVEPQQSGGMNRAAVGVARHEHPASRRHADCQHRLDAEGAAPGAEKGVVRPKGARRQDFRLLDRVPPVVEAAGVGQLGEIRRQALETFQHGRPPLVSGGVERCRLSIKMRCHRVRQRRITIIRAGEIHPSSPSLPPTDGRVKLLLFSIYQPLLSCKHSHVIIVNR